MYAEADYDDVVGEVAAELRRASIERAPTAGVPRERLIVDPGHRVCQTRRRTAMVCWRGCPSWPRRSDRPVLVGPSRKSFMRDARRRPARRRARLGHGGGRDRGGARRARTSSACTPSPRWCRWSGWRRRSRRHAGGSERTLRLMHHGLADDVSPAPAHRAGGTSLDILVVSILIYEVLKLIRGTRAVQMALGGGVLVALFYGSRWGHLETVNWLIRNLVGYVVFAVIVLFQSDIRRALAHLGRAPFFRYFAKAESAEESIEELVVAAEHAVGAADRRDHRARAADRAAQLHRGRHSARRRADLRSAASASSSRRRRCTTARSSSRRIALRRPPASCR